MKASLFITADDKEASALFVPGSEELQVLLLQIHAVAPVSDVRDDAEDRAEESSARRVPVVAGWKECTNWVIKWDEQDEDTKQ